MDIDVAVAFAARAHANLFGGAISDEQVAEIDQATRTYATRTCATQAATLSP